jgi:hypothetical protein
MTSRNSDASYLTERKQKMNQAYFFNRQAYSQYPSTNPQTGVYDASKVSDLVVGTLINTYRTGGPLPLVSDPACTCDAPSGNSTTALPNYIQRN